MAVKQTRIDDLDGKTEGAEAVIFGVNGEWFTIDLAEASLKKLVDANAPFMEKAIPLEPRDAFKLGGNGESFSPAVVRAWAAANGKTYNGKPLSDRGRVPQEIVDEWRKATNN